jgi:hypothetical protein
LRRWCAWFACVSLLVPTCLVLTEFGAFAKVASCYDRSNPDALVGTQKAETLRGRQETTSSSASVAAISSEDWAGMISSAVGAAMTRWSEAGATIGPRAEPEATRSPRDRAEVSSSPGQATIACLAGLITTTSSEGRVMTCCAEAAAQTARISHRRGEPCG